MRFIIIEKNRITFPALISSVFTSASEAKNYGFTKPKNNQAKVYKITNGFRLTDTVDKFNFSKNNASKNTKTIKCGQLTLYLKDPYDFCEIEIL
ncbi:MAG: hypothetical protein PVH88_27375 [Ignavibacteria bacterium]|jgi:hypothetical protein